ncbi:MAG TPA: AAA family ATPase [Pirellulales bacterium]|nr:AAA family ATPase [Pirellulales bacterium]
MLERIHVENYKCLRDVTVDLGDFTVLIGPNDSGKSSFLEVVQTFGRLARQDFAGTFAGDRTLANLVWHKDSSRQIVLGVAGITSEHRFSYQLEVPVDGSPQRESLEWDGQRLFWTEEVSSGPASAQVIAIATGQGKQNQPVRPQNLFLRQFVGQRSAASAILERELTASVEYHFDPEKLSKPSVPKPAAMLEPSGANLAAVLDVMQNSADRSEFEAVQKSLHDAVPSIAGIVLPPTPQQAGAKALEFILSGNGHPRATIPASLASSGSLLLTAFLTLAYTKSPGILLFEEPENGLHPSRLQMVVDILRRIGRGEVGNRKRQVIVTTHNPVLLNYATPEEVRVFVRHPEEGTRVLPMTSVPDIDRLLKEFSLGELWYLLGEEKLFQEQPA